MLDVEKFKNIVISAPLFAIDLVVLNEFNKILLGKRKNAPAKDYWFVPGGRIYKNESIEYAVQRISFTELGIELNYNDLEFLGLFEHFYNDSYFGPDISTHYINATHSIKLKQSQMNLPNEQHEKFRWFSIDEISNEMSVHRYSKVFLKNLENKSLT